MMKLIKKKATNNEVGTEAPKYNNLREIMDWNVPFQMIYSGVESDAYFNTVYNCGVRDFLMSYHYIQSKHINLDEHLKEKDDVRLFIDSGAHTYQNDPTYSEYPPEYWEKHIQRYLRWAEKNKKHIFAIASLDIEHLIGGEQVDKWNKQYFEPFMLRTGIPVCFVWHQNSYNTWEYCCQRYPYVGFSSVNVLSGEAIDINEYREKLKVAEKFDSLVHGFGMTRTSMLTQLPFYTSDSTTWLVGLQYGEINYWTGTKMSRLKKDKWKKEYLHQICDRYDLSSELLENEDAEEMIKANIYAFIDAQEFINSRLKSSMYWLKAKTIKVDVNNLPDDFFPDPEWFDGDCSNIKEYAKKMNINPDLPELFDVVYDVTTFMNWNNPKYLKMREYYEDPENENLINNLHDTFINRIVSSEEEKVNDLIKFYTACVSGEDDKLLQLGTNFDRMVKERDDYIEDEETELKDLTKEEINRRVFNFLPESAGSEAPEIDELDEEIFKKADIVPTFGKDGKFLKGQTRVRKPKKLYSDKYPKFACDTCYAAAKCPEYKAGYACAYNKMFNRFDTRNMTDIIEAMQGMVSHNLARMQRAMIIETMTGVIDGNVTSFINQNMALLSNLQKMYESSSAEVLRQTRVVRSDGSEEHTTEITNPQSGGILEKLFSNISSEKEEPKNDKPQEDMINTEAEESTQ